MNARPWPPYPAYTYSGADLSTDDRVGVVGDQPRSRHRECVVGDESQRQRLVPGDLGLVAHPVEDVAAQHQPVQRRPCGGGQQVQRGRRPAEQGPLFGDPGTHSVLHPGHRRPRQGRGQHRPQLRVELVAVQLPLLGARGVFLVAHRPSLSCRRCEGPGERVVPDNPDRSTGRSGTDAERKPTRPSRARSPLHPGCGIVVALS